MKINSSEIHKFSCSPITVTIVPSSIDLPFEKPGQAFQTEVLIQTVQVLDVLHVCFWKKQSYVLVEDTIAFIQTIIDIFYFRDAYKVACLGVTEGDWRALAMEALEVNFVAFLSSSGLSK